MRKYTILHTIETAGPGGAETVVLDLAARLDPQRFRSIALLPEASWLGRQLEQRGVPTVIATSGRWYDFRLPRAIARAVKQENVDLIHSHLPDQNFYSCLAAKMTGCKVAVTYHGPVELADAHRLKSAIKLWVVRNSASAVVVVCDFVRDMLARVGFDKGKIVRIYNGVNLQKFSGNGRGRLRAELGLQNGDNGENCAKLVGMVANIRQSKGYEYFIRAAHTVAQHNPEARFVAVGDVKTTLAEPLRKLLQELALEERFRFLGFREDVPAILKDLDVFVLSSTSEGFPLVTLEAMAAGKPVVVTRCGGPQEVVEDGRTGTLVPIADADALASGISGFLSDPARAAQFGASGREKVEREFSISRMVEQYEQLYERLLAEPEK
jgi:glycosyltransferase involved in cell wall biosynthesis